MVFSSFTYLLLFLPVTFLAIHLASHFSRSCALITLVLCSLFFYASWEISYLPIILFSIACNYIFGRLIEAASKWRKLFFSIAVTINISLLFYYKYTDFFIHNINFIFSFSFAMTNITLPLAISFFTFQQIAWLFDKYNKINYSCTFTEYGCAVSYFPHLIAGPLVQYTEIIPQLTPHFGREQRYSNIAKGLFLIAFGLFKKIMIADTLAQFVSAGYSDLSSLHLIFSWCITLGYCMQIYYDFSGYCDIAMGSSYLFNIRLPENFQLPYASKNISYFWRRWHITLGNFFTKCLYIPLGGSRTGLLKTCRNLLFVMLISGLWHGAGYGFIIWGGLHGLALVCHRLWRECKIAIPIFWAWSITFLFITLAWVFFRAESLPDALVMFSALAGQNGIILPEWSSFLSNVFPSLTFENLWTHGLQGGNQRVFFICLLFATLWSIFGKEPLTIWEKFAPSLNKRQIVMSALLTSAIFFASFAKMLMVPYTEFIYFNF